MRIGAPTPTAACYTLAPGRRAPPHTPGDRTLNATPPDPDARAILTGYCPDHEGLVAAITRWLADHAGNILHLDQHVDAASGAFFIRVEWDLSRFDLAPETIAERFEADVARSIDLAADITFPSDTPRMAVFVSKEGHCLWDILSRYESGEWNVHIPLIISNHRRFADAAAQFDIPYFELPVTKDTKPQVERRQAELLTEHGVDFVVLARYMQIISPQLLADFARPIINIHHSFLPAFAGARPYHQAHERGVKIIGATAHYVTAELDAGPIIEQQTTRVSHRDAVTDMVRRGKDLEKLVLSRAIDLHLNRQVIVHGNRTIVFA